MRDEKEIDLIGKSALPSILKESLSTLKQVNGNTVQASRNMNRLKRHSVFHLHRLIKLGVYGGGKK